MGEALNEIGVILGVHLCGVEAAECALGDGDGHRCLTYHENVFFERLFPKCFGATGGDGVVFAPLFVQPRAVNAISGVERIETALGIDFQHGASGRKHAIGHAAAHDVARSFEGVLETLVHKTITAQRIGEMHVDHAPRSEDGLLVGVAKGGKERGEARNALFDGELVGAAG